MICVKVCVTVCVWRGGWGGAGWGGGYMHMFIPTTHVDWFLLVLGWGWNFSGV